MTSQYHLTAIASALSLLFAGAAVAEDAPKGESAATQPAPDTERKPDDAEQKKDDRAKGSESEGDRKTSAHKNELRKQAKVRHSIHRATHQH